MICYSCKKKVDPILTFARPHGRYSRCEECRKAARDLLREKLMGAIWLARNRKSGGRILHAFHRSTERIKKAICGISADLSPGSGWWACLGPTMPSPGDDICDICAEKVAKGK